MQEELPNRLLPTGARRDLAGMRDGAERGRRVLQGQRYEVQRVYATGDMIILEVLWVGTLAVPSRRRAPVVSINQITTG